MTMSEQRMPDLSEASDEGLLQSAAYILDEIKRRKLTLYRAPSYAESRHLLRQSDVEVTFDSYQGGKLRFYDNRD